MGNSLKFHSLWNSRKKKKQYNDNKNFKIAFIERNKNMETTYL